MQRINSDVLKKKKCKEVIAFQAKHYYQRNAKI